MFLLCFQMQFRLVTSEVWGPAQRTRRRNTATSPGSSRPPASTASRSRIKTRRFWRRAASVRPHPRPQELSTVRHGVNSMKDLHACIKKAWICKLLFTSLCWTHLYSKVFSNSIHSHLSSLFNRLRIWLTRLQIDRQLSGPLCSSDLVAFYLRTKVRSCVIGSSRLTHFDCHFNARVKDPRFYFTT